MRRPFRYIIAAALVTAALAGMALALSAAVHGHAPASPTLAKTSEFG